MQAENKKNKNKFQHIWSEQMYRQWQDLQRQYVHKNWKIIEYNDESWELESWYVIFESKEKNQSIRRPVDPVENAIDIDLDVVNQTLVKLYLLESNPKKKFWEQHKIKTAQNGFIIPQSALVDLGMPNLKKSLDYSFKFSQHFPFHYLLKQHYINVSAKSDSQVLKLYHTIWTTIECYTQFLATVDDDKSKESMINYLAIIWNTPNIKDALPSLQLVHALMTLLIDVSQASNPSPNYNSENYLEEVSDFIASQKIVLETYFTAQSDVNQDDIDQLLKVKISFLDICTLDRLYIIAQELINNPEDYDMWASIPKDLKEKFQDLNSNSFINRFQSAVKQKSIIERIKSISSSQEQTRIPSFYKNNMTANMEGKSSWRRLSPESISQLKQYIKHHTFTQKENEQIQQNGLINLNSLFDTLTMPVIKWNVVNSALMPLWNTCRHEELKSAINSYDESRALELEEAKILDKIKKSISGIFKEAELDQYLSTVTPFSVEIFNEIFSQIVESKRLSMKNRRQFTKTKMEEFGITEELERSYKIRKLYLDELLIIEEEVRPYILYVKKAFDSALPENRENFFDPYRHSIDGIEFDPETIQNVDKWLKGEVMKTINIKQQIHQSLHINCFAMDSSGSMDNTKMRNLFKLIYLMITGLAGKASYDSFHFFGTYFVPAAEFNHSFNSKNLLYKILKKITLINSNLKIEYSGIGGTNISGAITKCHERIKEFAKPFEKQELNHFKSLFVITDGEPSIGIVEPNEIAELVNQKRQDGNVSIKGIYVGPPSSLPFMPAIFGKDEYVETDNFETAITELIDIMSRTFEQQRKLLKQSKKQR